QEGGGRRRGEAGASGVPAGAGSRAVGGGDGACGVAGARARFAGVVLGAAERERVPLRPLNKQGPLRRATMSSTSFDIMHLLNLALGMVLPVLAGVCAVLCFLHRRLSPRLVFLGAGFLLEGILGLVNRLG